MDPRKAAERYLEEHKLPQLFEALTAELLFVKPVASREYIVQYLEKVQSGGNPTLINEEDLDAMFTMADVTNRGVISKDQAVNALRSIMGPTVDPRLLSVPNSGFMKRDEFVKTMMVALKTTLAYVHPQ
ncbi:MAG: hypothetical protein WDW38_008270 [Sanguina aurantia]